MIEFTGERVIPGEVNEDLWAEHLARYAFASPRAAGARVWMWDAARGMDRPSWPAEPARVAASTLLPRR